MTLLFALLIAVSAGLTAIGCVIRRRYDGQPPGLVAVLYFFVIVTALSALVWALAFRGGGAVRTLAVLSAALLIAFPPIALMGSQVAGTLSNLLHGSLFGSSLAAPPPSDFSKAEAYAAQGDIDGALNAYRAYFDEAPNSANPLFAAAALLQKSRRFGAAAVYYREVMERFEKSDRTWEEAAIRLANIYEHHIKNVPAADEILLAIVRRAQDSEYRRLAADRLRRRGRQPLG